MKGKTLEFTNTGNDMELVFETDPNKPNPWDQPPSELLEEDVEAQRDEHPA